MHQDSIGWKIFPESFLTVVIPIDETTAENGATEVFPGIHQKSYLSPRDGEYHQLDDDQVDLSTGVLLEMSLLDSISCSPGYPLLPGQSNDYLSILELACRKPCSLSANEKMPPSLAIERGVLGVATRLNVGE